MGFKVYDPSSDVLELPVGDKVYSIVSPPREVGVFMQRMSAAQRAEAAGFDLSDEQKDLLKQAAEALEGDMERLVLGDVYDALVADGHTSATWSLVTNAAVLWATTNDRSMVEDFWNRGGQPEGKARKVPQDHKPKKK